MSADDHQRLDLQIALRDVERVLAAIADRCGPEWDDAAERTRMLRLELDRHALLDALAALEMRR